MQRRVRDAPPRSAASLRSVKWRADGEAGARSENTREDDRMTHPEHPSPHALAMPDPYLALLDSICLRLDEVQRRGVCLALQRAQERALVELGVRLGRRGASGQGHRPMLHQIGFGWSIRAAMCTMFSWSISAPALISAFITLIEPFLAATHSGVC